MLPSMGERVTSEFLDNWKKDDSIKLRIPVISKIYGRVLGREDRVSFECKFQIKQCFSFSDIFSSASRIVTLCD